MGVDSCGWQLIQLGARVHFGRVNPGSCVACAVCIQTLSFLPSGLRASQGSSKVLWAFVPGDHNTWDLKKRLGTGIMVKGPLRGGGSVLGKAYADVWFPARQATAQIKTLCGFVLVCFLQEALKG